jgi:hypothetical protein
MYAAHIPCLMYLSMDQTQLSVPYVQRSNNPSQSERAKAEIECSTKTPITRYWQEVSLSSASALINLLKT